LDSTFIIVWTPDRLIGVFDVSGYDKKNMWNILKGYESKSLTRCLRPGIIDLQVRNISYEIYSISVLDGTTSKDIIEMFQEDPVHSAELIRERGRNLNPLQKEVV
jgi:hypothetical protein